jgi:carbamoyl-phosphate synthase large subunit
MKSAILISSIGRRSQLTECFRQALKSLSLEGRIIGADAFPEYAPAAYLAEESFSVPLCSDPNFIQSMLDLCRSERVRLIVPTIDPELGPYAAHLQKFSEIGTAIAVSAPETVAIAADKRMTNRWLSQHGFPTVVQASPEEVLANPSAWQFPLILKPRHGSASIGVEKISSISQLETASRGVCGLIVEKFARGEEHTINAYVNRAGKCLCAIPHRRVEVRSGEVSKGITRKHTGMMDLARLITETLPGAWGALNLQCFLADDGEIQVTEINARFGGGYPLAHHAGADFPRWLLQETLGQPVNERFDEWQDGLLMLRHDTAVFVPPAQFIAAGAASMSLTSGGRLN